MNKQRKSTMIELVSELEVLLNKTADDRQSAWLREMIVEAKAGEYHDYKNQKYDCGKLESSSRLRRIGFTELARRIESGEFDEEADVEDCERMKRDWLENGGTEASWQAMGLGMRQ